MIQITNKEAIKRIEQIISNAREDFGKTFIGSLDEKVFFMAIEAISSSEMPNRSELANNSTEVDRDNGDLISRRKAFEYFVTLWECIGTIMDRDEWEDVCMTTANEIPSAQPEDDEWCIDCKEYDKEAHCCHRWTKQIRKTITELEADYPQAMKEELEYWKKRAERKKGEWLCLESGPWWCEFCDTNSPIFKEYNYCPNCGADMRAKG